MTYPNIRTTLRWCMGVAMIMLISGCDGSINFTVDGAVKHATNGEIFRGAAFNRETIDEDPERSKHRRDLYEFVADKAGVDTKRNFVDTLRANPHYSNVVVNGKVLAPGDETVDTVRVQFDVDKQVNVTINFLQPEKRVFGPLRLNKLPILDSIAVSMNGKPISTGDSDEILLARILTNVADDFSNRLSKAVQALKAQALIEAQCRKALPNTDDFEVDPSLSPPEKDRAYQAFEQRQNELVKACVQQRMSQSNQ